MQPPKSPFPPDPPANGPSYRREGNRCNCQASTAAATLPARRRHRGIRSEGLEGVHTRAGEILKAGTWARDNGSR